MKCRYYFIAYYNSNCIGFGFNSSICVYHPPMRSKPTVPQNGFYIDCAAHLITQADLTVSNPEKYAPYLVFTNTKFTDLSNEAFVRYNSPDYLCLDAEIY